MEGRYYQWRLKTCRKNLKNFKLKNSGDYHDLYLQKYILLLADIFKNFPNKFSVTYELDSTDFLFSARITIATCLKRQEQNKDY